VPLPETIPVRYTEEEADNFSIRPVKRQTFRLRELVDMVLRVTGKDLPRVQQILRWARSSITFICTGGRASRLTRRSFPRCSLNFLAMIQAARFARKTAPSS